MAATAYTCHDDRCFPPPWQRAPAKPSFAARQPRGELQSFRDGGWNLVLVGHMDHIVFKYIF